MEQSATFPKLAAKRLERRKSISQSQPGCEGDADNDLGPPIALTGGLRTIRILNSSAYFQTIGVHVPPVIFGRRSVRQLVNFIDMLENQTPQRDRSDKNHHQAFFLPHVERNGSITQGRRGLIQQLQRFRSRAGLLMFKHVDNLPHCWKDV